jgi:nucleoside-diphosphate kinase
LKIGRKIRKWNMDYLTKGPVFAVLLEGPGVVKLARKMVGSLFPYDSLPGTIRGDYAMDSFITANVARKGSALNIIHASGSDEEAEFERKLWFKEEEIYEY